MAKPSVLFLCTQNACRSQIAEAWARAVYGSHIAVSSAGIRAAGSVNPLAAAVMREEGVDMSEQVPKAVADLSPATPYDLLVTVCSHADSECPDYAGALRRLHVPFDDPPVLASGLDDPLPAYRRVRDQIEQFVRTQLPLLLPALAPSTAPVIDGVSA